MVKSAFKVIAEIHYEMGSPGLKRCMEVLEEQYWDLDEDVAEAYDDFRREIMSFVEEQTAQNG
jgi:hypothetical protein